MALDPVAVDPVAVDLVEAVDPVAEARERKIRRVADQVTETVAGASALQLAGGFHPLCLLALSANSSS